MKTYYIYDDDFIDSKIYQDFIEKNQSHGHLKIRAYAANQAIPISGLKIEVYRIMDDNKIIFFEGTTNESGLIEKINLPAPILEKDNLNAPLYTTYNIDATYTPDDIKKEYKVNMYDNVCVVQNINIVPETKFASGDLFGI